MKARKAYKAEVMGRVQAAKNLSEAQKQALQEFFDILSSDWNPSAPMSFMFKGKEDHYTTLKLLFNIFQGRYNPQSLVAARYLTERQIGSSDAMSFLASSENFRYLKDLFQKDLSYAHGAFEDVNLLKAVFDHAIARGHKKILINTSNIIQFITGGCREAGCLITADKYSRMSYDELQAQLVSNIQTALNQRDLKVFVISTRGFSTNDWSYEVFEVPPMANH